jgi:hypothetical protein
MRSSWFAPLLTACAVAAGACAGEIERSSPPGEDSPAGSSVAPPRPATAAGGPILPEAPVPAPGPAGRPPGTAAPTAAPARPLPLRRLSRAEYDYTLADTLGVGPQARAFATEVSGAAEFPEGGVIEGPELERLMETMEAVAREAAPRLAAELACDAAKAGEEACARAFAALVARRLYRRPGSAEELADLTAVYADARKTIGHDHANGLRVVLFAALMSPRFHYLWPLGDRAPVVEGGLVALDGLELASRLSYLVWQSAPDEALLAAAEGGKLSRPEGLVAEAQRLLLDPKKGGRLARAFVDGWMHLGPLEDKADGADGPLLLALRASALRFAEELVASSDRSFRRLITSREAFVNEATAPVWGISGVKGAELKKVDDAGAARAGLLTHPAFLAASYDSALSTPVRRGHFVYSKLAACKPTPPPAVEIPPAPERKPEDSVRQHLTSFTGQGACAGCHALMNPYGFALGAFDRLGRARDKDDYGKPVDTRVSLPDVGGAPVEVADAAAMARAIVDSEGARECFARQVHQFVFRRTVEEEDEAAARVAWHEWRRGGDDLRALVLSMVSAPAFRLRAPAKDEVLR